jgi:hypothetical protein
VLQEKRKIVTVECVTYEKVYKGESPSLVLVIEWQLGYVHTEDDGDGHEMIKCSTLEKRRRMRWKASSKAMVYHRTLFLLAEMQ